VKWLGALIAIAALSTAAAWIASGTSAAKAHRCPPTSKAAVLPKRAGKPMYADVNGDGHKDRITMRTTHRSGCRFFLLVQTRSRDYAVGVPSPCPRFEPNCPYPLDALAVRLGDGRAQLIVDRWEGASTAGAAFYEVFKGRLRLIRFPGESGSVVTLFGGVWATTYPSCHALGPFILLNRTTHGARHPRVVFRRDTYRLRRATFVHTRSRNTRPERVTRHGPRPPKWWNPKSPFFANCLVAGSSRRLN
jgi:hypothetical protein